MQGSLVTDKVLTGSINGGAETIQRKCRRLIEKHGRKAELGGERGVQRQSFTGRQWRFYAKQARWSWGSCG